MRILLITHFFPPKHNAGTENYTLGIAKALQKRGHAVQVLCAEDWIVGAAYWNGVTDELYQAVPVKRIHLNWLMAENPNLILYDSISVEKWLSEFLSKELFDVVHITSVYSLGVGVMRSVNTAGIPMVLTLMDFWFLCPKVQLLRSTGELCDGITSASQCLSCLMTDAGMTRKLIGKGISLALQQKLWDSLVHLPLLTKRRGFRGTLLNMSERKQVMKRSFELPELILTHSQVVKDLFSPHTTRDIRLLRNGHELSWLNRYVGKTPSDKLRVGFIGQITSIKGVHILIEAFKKSDLYADANLNIWGDLTKDINYVAKLYDLISADPSISLRGRYERENIADVLSTIDVLVVPSIWYENAPLVIQEAFATKTPVIASNLGGMAEAVSHNTNGLLFETGNVNDLAGQLSRFGRDPKLRDKLIMGIPDVKRAEQEAIELEESYIDLIHRENLSKNREKFANE